MYSIGTDDSQIFSEDKLVKTKARKDISQDVHEIHTHNQENTQGEHADQHTSETI